MHDLTSKKSGLGALPYIGVEGSHNVMGVSLPAAKVEKELVYARILTMKIVRGEQVLFTNVLQCSR